MPLLQAIAAKCDDGIPCCEWIGPKGSGHFVKMVHNGIEYALIQLLAESYDVMKRMLLMSINEINCVVATWNKGTLHNYLMGITDCILKMVDKDGNSLVESILDYVIPDTYYRLPHESDMSIRELYQRGALDGSLMTHDFDPHILQDIEACDMSGGGRPPVWNEGVSPLPPSARPFH